MTRLSRREVLEGFLGMAVAASACKRARVLPPGEIPFHPERLGHRVRDGFAHATIGEGRREDVGVVIVGAGVAGLAAAWRFARAGMVDFVLLELDDAPGGTARSGKNAVSAYPWGAHYVTAPMKENRALVEVLREMGAIEGEDAETGDPVVAEELLCREPQERLFAGGAWHEGIYLRDGASAEDLAELSAFEAEIGRWAAWRDARGRRAFSIPVASCSDDAEVTALDRLSMAAWLDARGFRSRRLRWLVDYACRDDYGAHAEDTSAWAGIFYWASRMKGARAEAQPVVTWPEGNGRLVAHLFASARERTKTGVAAIEVVPRDDGVDVIALGDPPDARLYRASRVVWAAPQFVARAAIRDYRDAPPPHLADFTYGAWMVANLTVSRRPRGAGFPFAWDNVIYDSPSLGYVSATHQRGLDHGPSVLTYYYPLCDADPRRARGRLLSAGRDEWADVALADLEPAHPDIREVTTRLDVARWGHAMIRPRPGFLFGGARARAALPHRRVHFANTDLSGVALFDEALHHGVRAAEEVLAARGLELASLLR